ncbi:unnamed protein product [Sphenostylis stenocarpa]|uniref:Uncharacterized protein n=1 Tax=Sphenostylis stenocarpa TaxID=92480 RepID=A0AA86SUT9_9FABA|nr:unnamed protein product [Sphenostylis stenocarpa]
MASSVHGVEQRRSGIWRQRKSSERNGKMKILCCGAEKNVKLRCQVCTYAWHKELRPPTGLVRVVCDRCMQAVSFILCFHTSYHLASPVKGYTPIQSSSSNQNNLLYIMFLVTLLSCWII